MVQVYSEIFPTISQGSAAAWSNIGNAATENDIYATTASQYDTDPAYSLIFAGLNFAVANPSAFAFAFKGYGSNVTMQWNFYVGGTKAKSGSVAISGASSNAWFASIDVTDAFATLSNATINSSELHLSCFAGSKGSFSIDCAKALVTADSTVGGPFPHYLNAV